ncbi:MAG: hypothetical protein ACFB03_09415 [Paracoccaceae bacterium]
MRLEPLPGEMPKALARLGDKTWHVDGAVLEGAWSFADAYLLATTDGIPYEDGLHFSLLSPDRVEETVSLIAAYATGTFRLHGVLDREIAFSFFGDTQWTLRVLAAPVMHVPFFGDPRGVSRPWTFTKRLVVEDSPVSGE